MINTYARERIALSLGSDLSNNFISYFAVGSGSGTELVSSTTLLNEFSRFAITGSPNFTESRKVTFTGDLAAGTASGLILREFGLIPSGAALTGSVWSREALTGSIVCDGTIELSFSYGVEVM